MTVQNLVAGGIASALVAYVLVELVRRWSVRAAMLDVPNHRSSHLVPTPRRAGLGLAVTLLGGLWLIASVVPGPDRHVKGLLVVVATGAGVAAVSLVDDVRSLGALPRLVTHLVAGLIVGVGVGVVTVIDGGALGVVALSFSVALPLTIIWVAGFINAFNFMDGIDGIAGTQAGVAGLGWLLLGWLGGSQLLVFAGVLLAGTSCGFLLHNWSPARIFLGDCGSALLGFLLATVPWVLASERFWLASVLIVWPFVFDVGLTLVRRAARGELLWEAHRTHLYQRLVRRGWSHRSVAGIYGGLALLGLGAAWAMADASFAGALLTLLAVGAAAMALWWLAGQGVQASQAES